MSGEMFFDDAAIRLADKWGDRFCKAVIDTAEWAARDAGRDTVTVDDVTEAVAIVKASELTLEREASGSD